MRTVGEFADVSLNFTHNNLISFHLKIAIIYYLCFSQ